VALRRDAVFALWSLSLDVDAIAATSVQIPEQFLGAARSLLDVFIAGAGHYNAEPRFGLETAIGRIQN
jgi:hypothetical protein